MVEEKNLTDKPLRIITNPGVPYRDKALNVLAESLESIGLGVETEFISFVHILNILQESHDYDLVVVGLGSGLPFSPIHPLWMLLHSSSQSRIAGIDNETQDQLDTLLEQALWAVAEEEYNVLISEVNKIACENFISIPFFAISRF